MPKCPVVISGIDEILSGTGSVWIVSGDTVNVAMNNTDSKGPVILFFGKGFDDVFGRPAFRDTGTDDSCDRHAIFGVHNLFGFTTGKPAGFGREFD